MVCPPTPTIYTTGQRGWARVPVPRRIAPCLCRADELCLRLRAKPFPKCLGTTRPRLTGRLHSFKRRAAWAIRPQITHSCVYAVLLLLLLLLPPARADRCLSLARASTLRLAFCPAQMPGVDPLTRGTRALGNKRAPFPIATCLEKMAAKRPCCAQLLRHGQRSPGCKVLPSL